MKRVFNEDQQQMEALNVNLYFKWKTVDWFGGFFLRQTGWKMKWTKKQNKKSFCLTPKSPNNDMNQTDRAM